MNARSILALAGAAALLLSSCTSESPVAVRLIIDHAPDLALTTLAIRIGETSRRVTAQDTVLVYLPTRFAGEPVVIQVRGLRGESPIAAGVVTTTPNARREVSVRVALTRLACGAWCVAGTSECRGAAVVTCEQRDEDTCMEWSEPIACSPAAPTCSLGQCGVRCVDECAIGEARCDGPGATRLCGQADDDACLDWLPAMPCGAGLVCANGRCEARCEDECTLGDTRCIAQGRAVCGDLNADGCAEWGPTERCTDGEACVDGRCTAAAACTDECTIHVCAGDTFRTCGSFDFDSCRELSSGTRCAPEPGSCDLVSCTPMGCARMPRACFDAGGFGDAGLTDAGGALADAGFVHALDAGHDAGDDAGHDAGNDAGSDAGRDAGPPPAPPPPDVILDRTLRVDTADTAIALDSSNRPHVVTTDPNTSEIKYFRWDGAGWTRYVVDRDADWTGNALALVVNAEGRSFFTYRAADDSGAFLHLVERRVSGAFVNTEVTSPEGDGYGSSIALDASGVPTIATCDDSAGARVRLYNYEPTVELLWQVSDVSSIWAGAACRRTAILFSPDGAMHLSQSGGFVSYYTVSSAVPDGRWVNLAAGTSAPLGVWSRGVYVVREPMPGTLRFDYNRGTPEAWSPEVIATRAASGRPAYDAISVGTDGADIPHVVYRDVAGARLMHAVRRGDAWTQSPITGTTDVVAESVAAVVGTSGVVHLVYADAVDHAFHYRTVR